MPRLFCLVIVLGVNALLLADEAAGPVVLDDCESLEVSQKAWQMSGVTAELSSEHVTGGKASLKLNFPKEGGALELNLPGKRADWSRYQALRFDVFNPQDQVVELLMRIDDAWAQGFKDRFEPCGQMWLPPGKMTHIEITMDDLQANNFRLMDTSQISYLNLHLAKSGAGQVLYMDSFEFVPATPEQLARRVPDAAEPLVLDDFSSAEKTSALWKSSEAQAAVSDEHAGAGQHSLKVTFPPSDQWPGIKIDAHAQPLDWRPYKTLLFDAYNPADQALSISVRIDAANTIDKQGRFVVSDIVLGPQKTTSVKIDVWRMASLCGMKMDKARITLLAIYTDGAKEARTIFLSAVRLGVSPGGLKNEMRPGPIPGKDPAVLGKELLDDPEIKPLIPIFKAIPPKRLAICSHSASMSTHWSTSGAFFDIAVEALKAVNPGIEYQGFHQGGMGADTAVSKFLKPMQEYKPTDTYLLVVPDPLSAQQKLMDDMKAAGSRVFVFDAIKSWAAYSDQTTQTLRKLCEDRGATYVELMARGWGAPGSYKWTTSDTCHMTTPGHIFYAKELLKDWAKIYAAK